MTVIMPTFCREEADKALLRRSIESVLNQEFSDFEFIITDDGSTEDHWNVIRSYAEKDRRIKALRSERNSGLIALSVNRALMRAQGAYIAYMVHDSFWYPNALKDLYVEMIKDGAVGMAYGAVAVRRYDSLDRYDILGNQLDTFQLIPLMRDNFIVWIGVLHKKECMDRVGFFDHHVLIRRCFDWDMWIRIAQRHNVKYAQRLVGEYMVRPNDKSLTISALAIDLQRKYMSIKRDDYLRADTFERWDPTGLALLEPVMTESERLQVLVVCAEFFLETNNIPLFNGYTEKLLAKEKQCLNDLPRDAHWPFKNLLRRVYFLFAEYFRLKDDLDKRAEYLRRGVCYSNGG